MVSEKALYLVARLEGTITLESMAHSALSGDTICNTEKSMPGRSGTMALSWPPRRSFTRLLGSTCLDSNPNDNRIWQRGGGLGGGGGGGA